MKPGDLVTGKGGGGVFLYHNQLGTPDGGKQKAVLPRGSLGVIVCISMDLGEEHPEALILFTGPSLGWTFVEELSIVCACGGLE